MKIMVIGLGERVGDLTRRAERALLTADKVFIRTAMTEAVKSLAELGVDYISFDDL